MEIRILKKDDIEPVLTASEGSYMKETISFQRLCALMLRRKVVLWGCFQDETLCGALAIRMEGQIVLFFVLTEEREDIGKGLLAEASDYFVQETSVQQFHLLASEDVQDSCLPLGFHIEEQAQSLCESERVSLVFDLVRSEALQESQESEDRPDATDISDETPSLKTKKRKPKPFLIYILTVILLLGICVAVTILQAYQPQFIRTFTQSIFPEKNRKDQAETETTQHLTMDRMVPVQSVESIEPYTEENLIYVPVDKRYSYTDDSEGREVLFDVAYPQLEGLPDEITETINPYIESCAKSTVDKLYDQVMGQEEGKFSSTVTYKIAYMSQDFISIVFEDRYYTGSETEEYLDLRTLNMNLVTGMIYTLADVVNLDEAFLDTWSERIQEADQSALISEKLNRKEVQDILTGKVENNDYWSLFYVSSEGIHVGLNYHYDSGSKDSRGWLTAVYSMEEMKSYQSDSEFWGLTDGH